MRVYLCFEVEAAQTGENRVYYYCVVFLARSSMPVTLVSAAAIAMFALVRVDMRLAFGCFWCFWVGGRLVYLVLDLYVGIVIDGAQCSQIFLLHHNIIYNCSIIINHRTLQSSNISSPHA